jgi:hypothetical protein
VWGAEKEDGTKLKDVTVHAEENFPSFSSCRSTDQPGLHLLGSFKRKRHHYTRSAKNANPYPPIVSPLSAPTSLRCLTLLLLLLAPC